MSLSNEKLYYDWLQEEAPEDLMTDAFLKSNRRAFQVSQLEKSQTILWGTEDSPEKSDWRRDVAAGLALGAAALLFKGGYDYYNGESPRVSTSNLSERGNEGIVSGLNRAPEHPSASPLFPDLHMGESPRSSERSLTPIAYPLSPTSQERNTLLGELDNDPVLVHEDSICNFLMTQEQHHQLVLAYSHYDHRAKVKHNEGDQKGCVHFE